jgi:hypothetical protein
LDYYADFGRFLPKIEDIEPFLRPYLGGKLGGEPQLKLYINHRFLTVQEVQNRRNVEEFMKPKTFLCREAIEEAKFGGQFWELRSTFFSSVSCVGFMRLRRTQIY